MKTLPANLNLPLQLSTVLQDLQATCDHENILPDGSTVQR